MARRTRAAPVTIIHVHQQPEGDKPAPSKRKSKTYESIPKYGRQDEPVGKGTKGQYRKSKPTLMTGHAASEVE